MEEETGEQEDSVDDRIAAVMGFEKEKRVRSSSRWDDDVHRMEDALMSHGGGHRVTEIYSPPRVTHWAQRMRLVPGIVFDMAHMDKEDGKPWDFNNPDKAKRAKEWIEKNKPLLLMGSPPYVCSLHSDT